MAFCPSNDPATVLLRISNCSLYMCLGAPSTACVPTWPSSRRSLFVCPKAARVFCVLFSLENLFARAPLCWAADAEVHMLNIHFPDKTCKSEDDAGKSGTLVKQSSLVSDPDRAAGHAHARGESRARLGRSRLKDSAKRSGMAYGPSCPPTISRPPHQHLPSPSRPDQTTTVAVAVSAERALSTAAVAACACAEM